MGCPTVLIGEGGSGSASGGGTGGSGAASAAAGAATALTDNVESTTKEEHWIELEFVDKAGNAISGIHYKFTDSENKVTGSVLKTDGRILRDGIKEGECKVVLIDLFAASWSNEKAKVGDTVKLSVKSLGIENGVKVEFNIFIKDANYKDYLLRRLESEISNDKAEVEWKLEVDEKFLNITSQKESFGRYSQPFFYFDVYCAGMIAKSSLLYYEDWVTVQIKDDKGKVIGDKEFKAVLPTGEIREGKLDGNGKVKIEKVPPGKIKITLKP